MEPADTLRVIDFGSVSPLRSQTLWHAAARGVSDGSPPTLSFCRPNGPYVGIGYHRRLAEIDLDWCSRRNVPVYRRMVGGGPVYLDSGQFFFQISLPLSSVPPSRPKALRFLLEPAVEAFTSCGIEAHLDERLEVTVGDRKICGYGAGQIGDAVIVVGNLIETFDHASAAAILRTPSPTARAELDRLVNRYIAATPADPDRFQRAAVEAYSDALGLRPEYGALNETEHSHLAELDELFADPVWLQGQERPSRPGWQAKVKAGVWLFEASRDGTALTLGIDGDQILSAAVADPDLNGQADELAASLVGQPIEALRSRLATAGRPGRRLGRLWELAEPGRVG
ncbi:MAG: hypothetical protein OEM40_00330 [Acidimicrobiia bacterium]|nr:hypothetical protein [Acidimicrobiia bacterium]